MSRGQDVLPETQYAIQLVGPSELRLNKGKPVPRPGAHQVVGRVEAVGLCFSDLKLLKQFSKHPRKTEILSGISPQVLSEIPSYVPGDLPTVPGHEAVVRIVAVGEKVAHHAVGQRCLVQTDYRSLPTAASNASFGYNFEGGLQEYVLMDERIIIDPTSGERFLIPVSEELSASAVCLVEPWACVEDSYVNPERQRIKAKGRLLVVAESGHRIEGLLESLSTEGKPASVTVCCADAEQRQAAVLPGMSVKEVRNLSSVPDESFDDIVYFGAKHATIETLNDKLAAYGLINLVLGGRTIGRPVSVSVGRVHYGMTRWTGTTSTRASAGYETIPTTGEIRPGERIVVVGAAGPMGQMHMIRDVCLGIDDISIVATDLDDDRLETLRKKTEGLARANGIDLGIVNPKKTAVEGPFSYHALMVPVAAMVEQAIRNSTDRCLINVFAGIPAPTRHELDLDTYVAHRCYMFGTSGSVIRDMKIVLSKMEQGQLDINCSVDAISGMVGAVDGMAAVEHRTLAGKIIVYPMLHEIPLIQLSELKDVFPTVAEKLDNGAWCKAAEDELLHVAGGKT